MTNLQQSTTMEVEEELEAVNTLKVFDEELKLIEEWLKKPKYDEKYQNNFVYDHVYGVDKFFKYANPKRHIQPKVAKKEKGEEEEEEIEEQTTKGSIEEQQRRATHPRIKKLKTSIKKKRKN